MRVAVTVFPGSNCDHDVLHVFESAFGAECYPVWHRDQDLRNPDLVVIPGGFSFGDYLRCGAIAKVSPVMQAVVRFAQKGGRVLGICNGFQILCEAQLLPGVLLQNRSRKFLSRSLCIRAEKSRCDFTHQITGGTVLEMPVAHFDGNYFASADVLERIESNGQVVFRYCSPDGDVESDSSDWNPNGSMNAIAGVCSENGRVLGLMPHPERAVDLALLNRNPAWIPSYSIDSGAQTVQVGDSSAAHSSRSTGLALLRSVTAVL